MLSAECFTSSPAYFQFLFRYCKIPTCMLQATHCWYQGGAELLSLRTVGEENLHSENTSEIIPEKNKTGKQGKTGGRLRPG